MGLLFQFPLMAGQVCLVVVDPTMDPTEFLAFLSVAVQGPQLAVQEPSEDGRETRDHRHLAGLIQRLPRRRITHPCQWQVYNISGS